MLINASDGSFLKTVIEAQYRITLTCLLLNGIELNRKILSDLGPKQNIWMFSGVLTLPRFVPDPKHFIASKI